MIHLSETEQEQKDIQEKYGVSPAQYIADAGLLRSRYLLTAHSVWLSTQDIDLLSKANVTAVTNPQCNAKLASGFLPVQAMREKSLRLCMGTDGAASNNSLDILSELQFFAKLYRLQTGDMEGFSGPELFDCATIRSAEAIGWGDQRGSIEPGKQADFLIFNFYEPHLTPLSDVYSHLIYSARSRDIEDVYVDGKCLMKKRKIKVTNVDKAMGKAQKLFKKMSTELKTKTSVKRQLSV